MKFVVFRTSQPHLEKPLIFSTCKEFKQVETCVPCSSWNMGEKLLSKDVATIDMGDFRFEGDPRCWKCNQIEVEKAVPNRTECRGYYTKTY
mgnify:CR=1